MCSVYQTVKLFLFWANLSFCANILLCTDSFFIWQIKQTDSHPHINSYAHLPAKVNVHNIAIGILNMQTGEYLWKCKCYLLLWSSLHQR